LIGSPFAYNVSNNMEITQTLHVTTRKDWRAWLKKHYKTEKEIWLVYYKKATGKAADHM
jgi:hypothetical protein